MWSEPMMIRRPADQELFLLHLYLLSGLPVLWR